MADFTNPRQRTDLSTKTLDELAGASKAISGAVKRLIKVSPTAAELVNDLLLDIAHESLVRAVGPEAAAQLEGRQVN